MTDTLPKVTLPAEFTPRLDFYWQNVAMYAVTLILYVVLRAIWESTLQQGQISVVVGDPVVVLLGAFVLIATTGLVVNSLANRTVIISEDGITFTSRFHERTFSNDEIERISVGRDHRIKVRGVFSVIKIRIRDRRRLLRVRPALYNNEHDMVAALLHLRNRKARAS
jgi:hypothetical protein